MKRPVIGITLDSGQPGGYSKYPWHAIRQNYADAVVAPAACRSPRDAAYGSMRLIDWPEGFCPQDIGARTLAADQRQRAG